MEHCLKLQINDTFDIHKFFKDGYAVTRIDLEVADYFLEQVRSQVYVTGDGYYASAGYEAPLISKWEASHTLTAYNEEAPKIFKTFWEGLSNSKYFNCFTEYFGPFSQGSPMINNYAKNSGMVWHSDSYDSTFMTNILYLTKDVFDETDGGYLGIGKAKLNRHGGIDEKTIEEIDRILPNHGIMVTINNLDFTKLHRVEELKVKKERYSLLCHLGYMEHTLTQNRLKEIRRGDTTPPLN